MKKTIHNEAEKEAFIHVIHQTEIKGYYRAEFTKIRRKRSLSQNNLCWLYLTIGEQETGNDRNDLYAYFLNSYPTTKQIEICDEICSIPITSSAFNTIQMTNFIENIRRELAQMGIHTPDPESDKCLEIFNHYHERGII